MSSALLPKPQMRGLLANRLRSHMVVVAILSIGSAVLYKFTVAEPRKRKYEAFYKNCDPMEMFEQLREAGVLESAPPKES